MNEQMLYAYAHDGVRILGDALLAGERSFWSENRGSGDSFTAPRLFLNDIELQGDPSLRMP